MTLPAVGASEWASGSQEWNGIIGSLMANASRKAAKIHSCVVGQESGVDSASRSNVRPPEHVQREDPDQQEEAAGQAVQHELDARRDALRTSPEDDHEVHGNHRDFPEHEEQEDVQRA